MKITVFSVILAAAMAVLLSVGLSACGVKPGAVDPPQGVEKDKFPHTYPHPQTIHQDDGMQPQ